MSMHSYTITLRSKSCFQGFIRRGDGAIVPASSIKALLHAVRSGGSNDDAIPLYTRTSHAIIDSIYPLNATQCIKLCPQICETPMFFQLGDIESIVCLEAS